MENFLKNKETNSVFPENVFIKLSITKRLNFSPSKGNVHLASNLNLARMPLIQFSKLVSILVIQ